jgi:hypothetical protein
MATQGRFLLVAAFWADSVNCETLLQCDGQDPAIPGRSLIWELPIWRLAFTTNADVRSPPRGFPG